MRVRLTVGDQSATANLADNPTARDFASLLPLTLTMHDLFGLEKPGTLPRALDEGGKAQFTYEVGQLGYWSPSRALAVVYAVDGEGSIPGPGLIPLGTVDAGLETIADGGDSFQLRIEQIDWTLKAPRIAQGQDPSGTEKSLGGFAPALVRLAATADANDAAYRQKYAASPYLSSMIGSQARAATVQISPRADWPRNDTQPFVCVIVDHSKHDFYPS